MAHSYSSLFKLPTTGLRFFTVYGPWGRPDMALFLFTRNILEGRPIEVFNYGHHRRDFTYVEDIAEGVVRVLDRVASRSGWDSDSPDPATSRAPFRLYNIGNNQPVELLRYIEVIEECLGRKAEKSFLPLQPGDVPEPLPTSMTGPGYGLSAGDAGRGRGAPVCRLVLRLLRCHEVFMEPAGTCRLFPQLARRQPPRHAGAAPGSEAAVPQLGPILAAIEKVCASQHFILGAEVRELEEKIATYSLHVRHRRLLGHRCLARRAHGARHRARG